jgi:hypothetical protein
MEHESAETKPGNGPEGAERLEKHDFDIIVNGHVVRVDRPDLTGLAIKEAAIAKGVKIQLDFVLFEDQSNGKQVVVKDDQRVKLHERERFEAITNDDNS